MKGDGAIDPDRSLQEDLRQSMGSTNLRTTEKDGRCTDPNGFPTSECSDKAQTIPTSEDLGFIAKAQWFQICN